MVIEAAERDRDDLGIPGLGPATFVGRGGAAVVYKAEQHSLQRTVAVKLLTSAWDETVARRFDREQRAMGRLSNTPGIVPVYASGRSEDGSPYLIMPFYSDGSLKDWSEKNGPIGWEQAAEICIEVAVALGKAHDVGIVHRDLKPANILLTRSGSPMLADFGLARLAADGKGDTTSMTFTPAYCPPEALDEAEPTPTVDTYALAATFWALVEGYPPFTDGGRALAMEAILKRVLTESPAILETVPGPISAFIDRSMSKDPTVRPQNGAEFASGLRNAVLTAQGKEDLDDDTTVGLVEAPPPAPQRASFASRRNAVRVLAAVALLVAGGIVAGLALRSGSDEAQPLSEAPVLVEDPGSVAEAELSAVVLRAGQSILVQTIAADASFSQSLQLRRAVQAAIGHHGDINGFEVEQRSIVEFVCEQQLDSDALLELVMTEAVALIGSTCLDLASVVAQAGSEQDLVWISPSLRLPELTSLSDGQPGAANVEGFFRTALNDHFQGAVAALFASEELGAKSAVVLYGASPGHQDIANSFVSAFSSHGDVELIELTDESNLAEVAQAAEDSGSDVMFMALDSDTAMRYAAALSSRALASQPRIGIEAVLSDSSAGSAEMNGVYVVTPLDPAGDAIGAGGMSLNEIMADYELQYGGPPDDVYQFAAAYDAMSLLLGAVESAATTSDGGLTIERAALREALESAKASGLTGLLECNHLGDCGSQAMSIVQIEGGSVSMTLQNVVKIFDRS